MDRDQREYYLRQQLRAIQEELGETDETQAEINELRVATRPRLDPPEAVRKAAERELDRLSRLPPASAEHSVIRTYLDWILALPWSTYTEDNLDLEPGARESSTTTTTTSSRSRTASSSTWRWPELKQDVAGPILCFVGPPGVGKTSLGQSIARALGRKFTRMSVGGVRDEAEIRGHRRTYIGAMPGTLVRAIRDAGVDEPRRHDRRDRQDGLRLPRRPGLGDARGARPGAEPRVSRPLPRPAARPLAGAVHLHRERARHHPAARCSTAWRSSASRATPTRRSSTSRAATWCRARSRRTA